MEKIKKTFTALSFVFFFVLFFLPTKTYAYSPERIIEDSVFRNSGTMTELEIQTFLVSHNSYLASYTIPAGHEKSYYIRVWDPTTGRYISKLITSYINPWIGPVGEEIDATGWPVSRVIYNASQWYNVNPQVIISILQKESSLAADSVGIDWLSQDRFARMAWVMGYAYTEDPTDPAKNVCDTSTNHNPTGSCAGVAMQIDWSAGALDTWYKRSQSGTLTCNGGQPCSAGRTVTIDGSPVFIGNHITGPFYRYTPHYSWGGAFTWCMNNWFTPYNYEFVSQILPNSYMEAGTTKVVQLILKNTGTATWYNETTGGSFPTRLQVVNQDGTNFYVNDGNWLSVNRIKMTTSSVAPGQSGTFNFTIKAPVTPGYHSIKFLPIVENLQQMPNKNLYMSMTTT